jgi:hypothetical protein
MDRIHLVVLLTAIIHFTDTLFYAVRLSGVKTRRLITALSLFQMISLLAGVANMVQAPLLSAVVEQAINSGTAFHQAHLQYLLSGIRLIILAATAGTIAAAVIAPIFTFIMNRAVFVFERTGSVSQLLLMALSPSRLGRLRREITTAYYYRQRRGRRQHRHSLLYQGLSVTGDLVYRGSPLPIGLFLVHILVISIWTNGVLAALYAGALLPDFRSTASLLSGIVNGVASVLSNFIIDPATAVLTDQALQGQRDEWDMIKLTYIMMGTRLLGTILAQVLFVPTVYLVELLTGLLT